MTVGSRSSWAMLGTFRPAPEQDRAPPGSVPANARGRRCWTDENRRRTYRGPARESKPDTAGARPAHSTPRTPRVGSCAQVDDPAPVAATRHAAPRTLDNEYLIPHIAPRVPREPGVRS